MSHVVLRTCYVATEVETRTLCTVAMNVGIPIVLTLPFHFAPGVVTAVVRRALLRRVIVHVAAGPLRAGRQTEVDEVWVVVVGTSEGGLGSEAS